MATESREVAALRRYMADSGIPHRVTSTMGGKHATNSRHYQLGTDGLGLAVDFAGPTPGDYKAMAAIFAALSNVASQLHELIGGPRFVTRTVKNGQWGNPVQQWGAPTWKAHDTHVHVSVDRGTFVRWPAPPTMTVPIPVFDFEEATIKSTLVFVKLDDQGNGYSTWDPKLGRDPTIVGTVLQGPYPPADGGYWGDQAKVNLSAQPRDGAVILVARGGKPGDTIGAWVSIA
jgi:hypothetical protein